MEFENILKYFRSLSQWKNNAKRTMYLLHKTLQVQINNRHVKSYVNKHTRGDANLGAGGMDFHARHKSWSCQFIPLGSVCVAMASAEMGGDWEPIFPASSSLCSVQI